MTEYYYVGSALPELQIGHPPEVSSREFIRLCQENLTDADLEKLGVYRRLYDMENILAFWKKEELDSRSNYNANDLEDALFTREGLPDYVYDYLEKYETREERIRRFPELMAAYFRHELERSTGFLHELLKFEREWRLVFAGFRAKELEKDLANELQFEDPEDELVAQILAQKDAKQYEPPARYSDLKALFEQHRQNPLELHQALCEYRFTKIAKLYGLDVFTMHRLLGYFVQLTIVEKWMELDRQKGLEIVDTIVKEAT